MPRISTWAALVGLSVAAPAHAEPLDAVVETTGGARIHLSGLWKKPAVVFYEDKDSTALNQPVKDALFRLGRERQLLESVAVVAVANVQAFDWFPARNFVVAAVKDTEARFHLPVYCDFKGALSQAPWSLPSSGATTLVLDTRGDIVWQASGKLSEAEQQRLFDALEAQLRR